MAQATLPDVLTLEEASAYLRLPVAVVLRQASQGNIPGRKIEDNWRFLKTAIDDWLRSGSIGVPTQYAALAEKAETLAESAKFEHSDPWIKFAGMFKDDPLFDEFVEDMAAYRRELDAEVAADEVTPGENQPA
jgi:excisionase family DNA binding protein